MQERKAASSEEETSVELYTTSARQGSKVGKAEQVQCSE